MPLTVPLDQIPPEGLELVGEEAPDFLELTEGDFVARQPVRYRLRVQVLGDLIHVQGEAGTELTATCGRCLNEFPLSVALEDDHLALDADAGGEELDLRPALREDLLLELPSFPRCEDGDPPEGAEERTCPEAGRFEQRESPVVTEEGDVAAGEGGPEGGADDRWKALDGLEDLGNVPDPSPEEDRQDD